MEITLNLKEFLRLADREIERSYKDDIKKFVLSDFEKEINGEIFRLVRNHEPVIVEHTSETISRYDIYSVESEGSNGIKFIYGISYRQDFEERNINGKVVKIYEIPYKVLKVIKTITVEEWVEI